MISATKSEIIQEAAKPGEEGHTSCMGFATKWLVYGTLKHQGLLSSGLKMKNSERADLFYKCYLMASGNLLEEVC